MIGKHLGPFEITASLGKGGMGEVYRAHDSRLQRDVAIKILPADTQSDPERIARFAREARTLASLHHPNVASLFGLEQEGDQRFLVMELVEGVDLEHRMAHGAVALDEALDIARQLAEGLEEAHENGIVHRDLKPANVMLTPDGKVKILDFGLARAMAGEGLAEGDPAHSPTITAAMTIAGTILGTAAYMSPEQARGKPVDRRADLWGFGVILFEMLTGKRLFEGETTSDTLAAVLRADVPWDHLPGETPPAVRRLLERCLERDPRQRLRDIGEARVRLEGWSRDPSTLVGAPAAESSRRSPVPWLVAAVAVVIAASGWWPRASSEPVVEPATSMRVAIDLDGLDPSASNLGPSIVVSPDGTTLAYRAGDRITLQALDTGARRVIPGSEFSTSMAFSPSGRWIAYQADGRIWRASVTGGVPIEVCEVTDPRGLCWASESEIVFTRSYLTPLSIVSLETGEIRALTTLDSLRDERSHRWPSPLPGGKAILYMTQAYGANYTDAEIRAVEVETGRTHTVYRGGAFPMYAGSGHLVFTLDRTLVAVSFDPETFETRGVATPVLENVATRVRSQESDDGSAEVTWSQDGLLVYRTFTREATLARPSWFDLSTGTLEAIAPAGSWFEPKISPDGRALAISREGERVDELVLIDLESGVMRRIGSQDENEYAGGWSGDSRYLFTTVFGGRGYSLVRRDVNRPAMPDTLLTGSLGLTVQDVSADGTKILYSRWNSGAGWDLLELDVGTTPPRERLLSGGPGAQIAFGYSRDGVWFARRESRAGARGRIEIASVADPSLSWTVFASDGELPEAMWYPDGSALLVRDRELRRLIRVPIDLEGGVPRPGAAAQLFDDPFVYLREFYLMDVHPDGERALVLAPESAASATTVRSRTMLATGWFDRLRAVEREAADR